MNPDRTVPDELLGCWVRSWIRWADGRFDDRSIVVWLQTPSAMADLRLDHDRLDLSARSSLAGCTVDELADLARSQSSSGVTHCQPLVLAPGERRATVSWHTGTDGVDFQPESAFPEPGLMEWSEDGTVMIERAPSGAYEEEWRLLAGSRTSFMYRVLDQPDGRRSALYVAGDRAILVRDRDPGCSLGASRSLVELVRASHDDRRRAEQLVDCEFSFARRSGDHFVIESSTLPWRRGTEIRCAEPIVSSPSSWMGTPE